MSCAFADIIPVNQDRSVYATGVITLQSFTLATQTESLSATDFSVFDQSRNLAIEHVQPNYGGHVQGTTSQNSSISADTIAVSLLADASADTYGYDDDGINPMASALVTARFYLNFEVTQRNLYRLTSSLGEFEWGNASLTLTQGATTILEKIGSSASDEQLELMPGFYQFDATVTAHPQLQYVDYQTGRGEITFKLVQTPTPVPEPAIAVLLVSGAALLIRRFRSDVRAKARH